MFSTRALVFVSGLLAACGKSPPATAPDPGPSPPSVVDSLELVTLDPNAAFVAGDCNRCHHVPGVEDAGRLDSCQGCHVWIVDVSKDPAKRAKAMQIFPLWERYEHNVASYLQVPSLEAAMARLEGRWLRQYLKDPHDLRPHLAETMPRFDLDDNQVNAIVYAFNQAKAPIPSTPRPSAANLAIGGELFVSKGCAACHTFGDLHKVGATPLSPDLALTRERMTPDRIAAWILDPQAVTPNATMPTLGLSVDEAVALRDYIVLADAGAPPMPPIGPTPAPATEPVTWARVEERVFGRICVHCHMKPELNQGRAGPGNAGGFGWAATGIELQTREGVMAVADRIPAALERRRIEAHRDVVAPGFRPAAVERPDRPGMPLGLPPLSDEDTALVLGWIAQGMPE